MAEVAAIAYEDEKSAGSALERLGLRLDCWLDTRDNGGGSRFGDIDTQGLVASSDDLTVVAFRGTEPDPGDVLTDLKASMRRVEWLSTSDKDATPEAHKGF
jgi:hypothetical protein